eukprot:TRINITY_DN5025_c0_g2_i4.p1 TRINITY_DN5025_c0_g2~~TRINITY_DN5025_c0_g2_i4.p1  ORF type:complete len:113 (-),score=3.38 TRINITY_DN5025_c0_g2_i4:230-568(-)
MPYVVQWEGGKEEQESAPGLPSSSVQTFLKSTKNYVFFFFFPVFSFFIFFYFLVFLFFFLFCRMRHQEIPPGMERTGYSNRWEPKENNNMVELVVSLAIRSSEEGKKKKQMQ